MIYCRKKFSGRCAISNIPMNFGSCKDMNWTISLDRKNVQYGYMKNNVQLTCFQFNTCDMTINTQNDVDGSCSWTKDKFNIFLKSIINNL
jgi:hypothetical protein